MRLPEIEKMYRLEDSYWWYVGRRYLVKSCLRRLLRAQKSPAKILDVGCGTGATLTILDQFGEAWGCDLSPESLAFCRQRGHARLKQCPAEALRFEDGEFVVVTCLDVLEHVDDQAAVRELRRVCKPGGRLLIAVPAYQFLWSGHDEALHHKRRYTAGQLKRLLTGGGLQVERLTYIITFLFLPILVFRLLQKLRPRRGNPQTDHIILPKPLNDLLIAILRLETSLVSWLRLPFGVSVFCICRRP